MISRSNLKLGTGIVLTLVTTLLLIRLYFRDSLSSQDNPSSPDRGVISTPDILEGTYQDGKDRKYPDNISVSLAIYDL